MTSQLKCLLIGALAVGSACATAPPPAPAYPTDVPAGVSFSGGDGLSCSTRIAVRGTADGQTGIAAEYAWLRWKYPGHQVRGQVLSECEKKPADLLKITTAAGQDVTLYFDISAFFGKGFGL